MPVEATLRLGDTTRPIVCPSSSDRLRGNGSKWNPAPARKGHGPERSFGVWFPIARELRFCYTGYPGPPRGLDTLGGVFPNLPGRFRSGRLFGFPVRNPYRDQSRLRTGWMLKTRQRLIRAPFELPKGEANCELPGCMELMKLVPERPGCNNWNEPHIAEESRCIQYVV